MPLKPITVSQLNDYISRILGTDPLLGNVLVHGEASGVKYHSSGHVYFSLVDGYSKVNCFVPRDYVRTLRVELADGMEMTLTGAVSVFKKNGTYSLLVKNIEVSGEGSLAIAFEKLKSKLESEGLFDRSHKKVLPAFPEKIGVVTSNTGAAVRDILKIIKSRNDVVDVVVFPVLVQGDSAAPQISETIKYINKNCDDIDLLIVGRGGGSIEDLWPFNEEVLARSIFDSEIPIISAVGHEIDFTIADMVADVRAETPTAAAQIAVPDTSELKQEIDVIKLNMYTQLKNNVMYNSLLVDNMVRTMTDSLNAKINGYKNLIDNYKLVLKENDPRNILAGGYSIVENSCGEVISDSKMINSDEEYKITFNKGYAFCKIEKIGSELNDKKEQ